MKTEAIAEALHTQLTAMLGPHLVTVGYSDAPRRVLFVYVLKDDKRIPKRFKNVNVCTRVTGRVKPAAAS